MPFDWFLGSAPLHVSCGVVSGLTPASSPLSCSCFDPTTNQTMPICALISTTGGRIFGCHGGISPEVKAPFRRAWGVAEKVVPDMIETRAYGCYGVFLLQWL